MTKKQELHLAQQAFESSIEKFAEAMRKANSNYIAERGWFTYNLSMAWEGYFRACKRLAELGN